MIVKHAGIDLLRHGDTGERSYRGQLDDALSPLGWTQLRAAIFGRVWDAIVTSPLRRCSEFASELAAARRVPLRVDPRLAEYHFGDWQGVPIETLAKEQGDALARMASSSSVTRITPICAVTPKFGQAELDALIAPLRLARPA